MAASQRLAHCARHLLPGGSGAAPAPAAGGDILSAIKEFDTPTIFNATSRVMGCKEGDFQKWYTDQTIKHLTPDLGAFCGYAVTAEVSTNDDVEHIGFGAFWSKLKETEGPIVTVIKDIDSDPGRGASTGDGMARNQHFYGVVGQIYDGTVRDIPGIQKVGIPTMGWGTVPGHGPFLMRSVGKTVTVGQMEIATGDIIFADTDGATKVPADRAEEIVQMAGEIRRWESEAFEYFRSPGYDPETAGDVLMEKQKAYPLLEKYPTFNGSKSVHAATGTN